MQRWEGLPTQLSPSQPSSLKHFVGGLRSRLPAVRPEAPAHHLRKQASAPPIPGAASSAQPGHSGSGAPIPRDQAAPRPVPLVTLGYPLDLRLSNQRGAPDKGLDSRHHDSWVDYWLPPVVAANGRCY